MSRVKGVVAHTIFNLMGTMLPLMFAVVSVPVLIHLVGTERFGFLALMWAVAGYAGLLDLGLSRTMARRVALGTPDAPAIMPDAVWTNVRRVLLVGCCVAALLIAGWALWGDMIVRRGDMSPIELNGAVRFVALMVPCIAATSALRGVLEGSFRFGRVNIMRGGFTVAAYCMLMAMARFRPELPWLVAGVLAVRSCDLVAHLLAVRHELSSWRSEAVQSDEPGVWRESAWFMCSQAIVPFTMYMDRFFVGSMLGLAAVTHYSVPYELATKLLLLPIALSSALFPRFASGSGASYEQAGKTVAWVMSLPCLVLICLGGDILHFWVHFDVGGESTWALIALTGGIWFNSVAQIPYAWLQARGFVRTTVGLHLCELPVYLALMLLGAAQFGIVAVAIAWFVRAAADCGALLWLVQRKGGPSVISWLSGLFGGGAVVLAGVLIALVLMPSPLLVRMPVTVLISTGLATFLWLGVVSPDLRNLIMLRFKNLIARNG